MIKKIGKYTIGNDGLVDVTSAMYPKGEPFKYYNKDEKNQSGYMECYAFEKR